MTTPKLDPEKWMFLSETMMRSPKNKKIHHAKIYTYMATTKERKSLKDFLLSPENRSRLRLVSNDRKNLHAIYPLRPNDNIHIALNSVERLAVTNQNKATRNAYKATQRYSVNPKRPLPKHWYHAYDLLYKHLTITRQIIELKDTE